MYNHAGLFRRNLLTVFLLGSIAVCQTSESPRPGTFEGQDATVLSNGSLELTVLTQGSIVASIVITDGGEKLNPLWNPLRLARDAGRTAVFNGTLGHFVCVDGFGQSSAEERAAGLLQHGEAHVTRFSVSKDAAGNSVSLNATLPIVQENFSRTFRMAPGENVIYVDSQLESLLGFDRPVNWGSMRPLPRLFSNRARPPSRSPARVRRIGIISRIRQAAAAGEEMRAGAMPRRRSEGSSPARISHGQWRMASTGKAST